MKYPDRLMVFSIEEKRYALGLSSVETVIRAVEITTLPKAPDIVSGIINMHGRVIAVCDIRKRFGLPQRELGLSDQLIIAHTPKRPVALPVDRVEGVFETGEQDIVEAGWILPQAEYVEGVVKLRDGMVLIHDLAGFLSLEEEKALHDALKESGQPQ